MKEVIFLLSDKIEQQFIVPNVMRYPKVNENWVPKNAEARARSKGNKFTRICYPGMSVRFFSSAFPWGMNYNLYVSFFLKKKSMINLQRSCGSIKEAPNTIAPRLEGSGSYSAVKQRPHANPES
ncbi:hypothetical protein NPIL_182001 [Nephila pilipes]|uniref:Uncharacterized protein n=1 Tax=Nephila pilipes TaxID=299642 RepID=A0A8X6NAY5_NEPPI|nr:hypothetical protein NPIL_182001 [Nephila pilipes]